MSVVHSLRRGLPRCRFTTDIPANWPLGHFWSGEIDEVNCPQCKEILMKTCEYKKSDMTPCVITDGAVCYAMNSRDQPICVGCERTPVQTGVLPPADWIQQVAEYKKK